MSSCAERRCASECCYFILALLLCPCALVAGAFVPPLLGFILAFLLLSLIPEFSIMGTVVLLGLSEFRDVCEIGKFSSIDTAISVGCDNAMHGDGQLVHFTCELLRRDIFWSDGDFKEFSFRDVGLKVLPLKKVCRSGWQASEDGTRTCWTIWVDMHGDEYGPLGPLFPCNYYSWLSDPAWGRGVPTQKIEYPQVVRAGNFSLSGVFPKQIPLESAFLSVQSPPAGWQRSPGDDVSYQRGWGDIGTVKVYFYGSAPEPFVSVIGINHGGVIGPTSPGGSWLPCPDQALLHMGSFSKAQMRGIVQKSVLTNGLAWSLRVLCPGFLAWLYFVLVLRYRYVMFAEYDSVVSLFYGNDIRGGLWTRMCRCFGLLPNNVQRRKRALFVGVVCSTVTVSLELGVMWLPMMPAVGALLLAYCGLVLVALCLGLGYVLCCFWIADRRRASIRWEVEGVEVNGFQLERATNPQDKPQAVALGTPCRYR